MKPTGSLILPIFSLFIPILREYMGLIAFRNYSFFSSGKYSILQGMYRYPLKSNKNLGT
jgi:hypothetical protein